MQSIMQSTRTDRTGSNAEEWATGSLAASARRKPNTLAERGQVLVLLVMSIIVLFGFVALVIDVSWYWSNSLRVQRAADAAALAGAVDLPGNPGASGVLTLGTGTGDAYAEAAKNGYTNGTGGVTVTPVQDATNKNQMIVTISAPVGTFFMRVFGIQTIAAARTSKALFTLPVPMGSPENYYGVFGSVRNGTYNNGAASTHGLTGPSTACLNGVANCYQDTLGQSLNPRGFWATMNTEGAANVNGDAYQPFYDTPTSTAAKTCPYAGTACYDAYNYYNYAISMPPNTSGGYVFIYDPVFCATTAGSGTGDRWFSGSAQVSTWYELFSDPNNTPYVLTDDTLIATSGTTFRDIAASDTSMGGSGGSQCRQQTAKYNDGRDYHDSWYLLNPGMPLTGGANGTVYRLHTTQSVPTGQSDAVNQKNTDGEQSFAIFATDFEGSGATPANPAGNAAVSPANAPFLPTVYGLGAMQMFTPLSASGGTTNSEFYLAKVPAFYAGKTLEVNLWDPGDTSPLAATLQIEVPTSAGWSVTPFTYSATVGTTNSSRNAACNSNSNSSPSNNSVQTSTGASLGLFNGCWLTLEIPIPTTYTGAQNGWWKILYSMTGNGTSNDVTTWTAAIKGNPVHLVVP